MAYKTWLAGRKPTTFLSLTGTGTYIHTHIARNPEPCAVSRSLQTYHTSFHTRQKCRKLSPFHGLTPSCGDFIAECISGRGSEWEIYFSLLHSTYICTYWNSSYIWSWHLLIPQLHNNYLAVARERLGYKRAGLAELEQLDVEWTVCVTGICISAPRSQRQ